MTETRHVLIVGGGVIGIASAHYLTEAGFRVTVIDRGGIGEACSRRNCGLVCPSHVLPLAEPGAISGALTALVQRQGAFRIRPRFSPHLWKWLTKFALRCNQRDMIESGRAIQPLLASSLDLYRGLAGSVECEWEEQGLLFVYRDSSVLESYRPTSELLAETFQERCRLMPADELLSFEPSLRDDVAGAWYFEEDAHLKPELLLSSWRKSLESRGVRFLENRELSGFSEGSGTTVGRRVQSVLASGESLEADIVVVATGAWTPTLSRILGLRVPIEAGKGYSVIVPRPNNCPRVPMIFPEHRVAVTPFQGGVRLGSIMEFAGYDTTISDARLEMLHDGASHYLRDQLSRESTDSWYGWRPMTYDSTPVIGVCPGFENVFLATGHNMLGLSMAPATGRLVSELITQRDPHVDPNPYRPTRF
ncbi:MAG: FAD-dependent oxidoreductase [Planctomycetota bacterium]